MRKTVGTLVVAAAATAALGGLAGTATAATGARAPADAAGMTTATPIPANAQGGSGLSLTPDSLTQCNDYYLCLWKNANEGSTFWSAGYFKEPHDTWLMVGSDINNNASSLWNDRDGSTEVAQYANGTGYQACIPGGVFYNNLADYYWPETDTKMNDSITSYLFFTTSVCS